jgi:hypothetical protein
MNPSPEVGHYPTRTGDEQFLRFFSNSDIQIIIIEPLLEERNFLRRTVVDIARSLATAGIGCFVPDLPGCGESQWDVDAISLADWRTAVVDAAEWLARESGRTPHVAALRGGALLDDAVRAASWWRFAPADGETLLRPLRRAARFSDTENALAGYALTPEMIAELERATARQPSGPLREYVPELMGTPLWRRAEPDSDPALVQKIADDLAAWVRTCAAA